MTELLLEDDRAAADLATFVRRGLRLDADGAARLQAGGQVLATWVQVLPGQGLTRSGTVLGLRVGQLAEAASVDVTVPLVALRDRFARDAGVRISLPPNEVRPPWVAITPPRTGWETIGVLDRESVAATARAGIDEVAAGTPDGAGAAAVATLRARVWGRTNEAGMPAGVAFGAEALGFLGEGTITWHRAGPWGRLSTPTGHVLAKV
ncbi:hypothetical protein [Calidifontibacter terrae]